MSDSVFPIKSGTDWSFEQIQQTYDALAEIAKDKYGLNIYPNQIEMVTSEQMLDAYAGHGMPIMYKHWSFGKSFIQSNNEYNAGNMGLAYEMVINSNPCINYLMEKNTAMMQTLVIAHAAFGHNHFFANNYLFKQWTDADGIIDYLMYANDFIHDCEEKYGISEVEHVIDVAHAWQYYGVDKYKRPSKLSNEKQRLKEVEFEEHKQRAYDFVMDRTVDRMVKDAHREYGNITRSKVDSSEYFEPQENILYFIEKHAPKMPQWKREIIRIVRKMAQYFYPQIQTKVMNEGFATFMHYHLIHDLREKGLVDQGFMLEFYQNHTAVVYQPAMSAQINPYALGFAMYMDIKRVAMEPTEEDRDWFGNQSWVGCGDWIETVKWATTNFKDESFIRQFLSPKVMKEMGLFTIQDDRQENYYRVTAIHDPVGFKEVRTQLADSYIWTRMFPEIQVAFYDEDDSRTLYLQQTMRDGLCFDIDSMCATATYLASLWEFPVVIEAISGDSDDSIPVISIEVDPSYDQDFDISIRIRDPI